MKTKRIRISVFLGIMILGILSGLYLFNKPPKTYEHTNPDFYLSVEHLVEEFIKDEHSANKTYLNKIIQIEGTVVGISTANQGKRYISFIDPMEGLTCTFDSAQSTYLKNIRPGDFITVKGRCDGKLSDVRLSKCILIE